MATLGDLKDRIVLEMNREDIATGGESEDALTTSIDRAIEFYSDETFWFNTAGAVTAATVPTVSAQGYVALPGSVRIAEKVMYGTEELRKIPLREIEGLTDSGVPSCWAANGDNIQLWPVPDGVYTLKVFGDAQVDAPSADGDSTVWTNEAYDLIAARTRFLLFRDVFRDAEGVQYAGQAEAEALSRLRGETRKRNVTPLRSTGSEPWARGGFNINTGDY